MSYSRNDKTEYSQEYNDAFNRLRISPPSNQFDAKYKYGIEDNLFQATTSGTANETFLSNESSYELSVGTNAGDKITRETVRPFVYQPGKGYSIILSGRLGPQKTGVISRIGYFDDNNGLFFQMSDSGISIAVRSSVSGTPVNSFVDQASWNIDPMDGTGPSGITLDPTKMQVFLIDFQWLGAGGIRFGFDIGGSYHYVHEEINSNNSTTVYMSKPDLPIRYEIENITATASSSNMLQTCSAVIDEGGSAFSETTNIRSINAGLTAISVPTGSYTPLISFQLKPSINGNNVTGFAFLVRLNIMTTTQNPLIYQIVRNATLTDDNFQDHPAPGSIIQYDIAASASSGGEESFQEFVAGNQRGNVEDSEQRNLILYPGNTYTVQAQGIGGSSNAYVAVNWAEVY